jgi:hypothetical protein
LSIKFIFTADILVNNISLNISKKYFHLLCAFNNIEEILNKIIFFLKTFYNSQTIVLKVAFMLRKIKTQTAFTLFLKLYFLTLS